MPATTPSTEQARRSAPAPDRLQALIVIAVTLVTVCAVLAVTGAPA